MTISEIIQRIRMFNNDDRAQQKKTDSYYTSMIIAAIGDLESYMGKLSIREDYYQFAPLRDSEGEIEYMADGVTPEIDATAFYYPDDETDPHYPSDIYVNKGLRVATGKTTGRIETAEFTDDFGVKIEEKNIVFIKINADVTIPDADADSIAFDVSLDNRESWITADYSLTLELDDAGTTGYMDVSKIPSKHIALKWTLTGAAVVKNTVFERLYIPSDSLRKYGADIVELAKLRILEQKWQKAIDDRNDPITINGLAAQITSIKEKYGLHKNSGDIMPSTGGRAVQAYPHSREEAKIFGQSESTLDLLTNNRIVSIKSDGTVRRI
jgi:hypothetical protein